jgi:hypothetical protein
MLPQRLAISPRAAAAALQKLSSRTRPRITDEGLQQVIDTVWDAERYAGAKGAPGKYMDLAYMKRALDSRHAGRC